MQLHRSRLTKPSGAAVVSFPALRCVLPKVVSTCKVRAARGACWFRSVRPIVAGEVNSSLMRAAMTADFSNGVSSALQRPWTFLNADLSISLMRMPVGEWILLDAETWIDPTGIGMAAGRLADERGYFGRCVQNLVVEKA